MSDLKVVSDVSHTARHWEVRARMLFDQYLSLSEAVCVASMRLGDTEQPARAAQSVRWLLDAMRHNSVRDLDLAARDLGIRPCELPWYDPDEDDWPEKGAEGGDDE